MVKKFAEPRGWALQWVFTQEAALPAEEQMKKGNSDVGKKFSEPRGWAAKWDGFSLSEPEKEPKA
jgi:hypothetical protein